MRLGHEVVASLRGALGLAITVGWALGVASNAACEQREAPTDMRLELPAKVESRDPVRLSVSVTNAQGAHSNVSKGAAFAVDPPELAQATEAGIITCSKSGDGKVTVTLVGVSRSVPLHCRLVAKVEVKPVGRVQLSAGPFKPQVRVLDQSGAELSDVEVSFISQTAGVAFPKDGMVVPKSVGTANLIARAGQVSTDFKVDVVRRVTAEALPLDNAKRVYISLDAGKYELRVTLKSPHRVSAEWRSAPYCNSSSDGLDHVFTCGLQQASGGGVVFDNPAYLSDGSAKVVSLDGVELNEVP